MNDEPIFKSRDLELIQSLVYEPSLEPRFCSFRDYLHWDDEEPSGISPEGYDALCDLWIARSFLHRGLDFSAHPIDPEYFRTFWNRVLKQGFQWPGFKRLSLTERERAYYEQMLKKENPF